MKMFFANLNVFIACMALLAMFAAGPVIMLLSVGLAPFGLVHRGFFSTYMYPLAYLLFSLPLLGFWWKSGLAPATRSPDRERRYRLGQQLVAVTNVATVAAVAVPWVLARSAGNRDLMMLAWFAVPVFALGFLVWGVGLFMIWSSGAQRVVAADRV